MTEVADQVCDGMLVSGATVLLKNRDCLGSPCNVIGFVRHARFSMAPSCRIGYCRQGAASGAKALILSIGQPLR
jgi:hypothetical protein